MAVYVVGLLLLLAMADHSDAAYCVCSSGGDSAFQKNIDYACGAGADCSAISQNGACFNPNTARDHCSYAVNSYYQRKGQTSGSCDFAGTATVSPTAPTVASGCVYPSSSSGGSTTPTGGSTTPTGGSTTPTTNPTFGGTPNSSTGGNTTGATPGSAFTPGIGIAPTGTGFGNLDEVKTEDKCGEEPRVCFREEAFHRNKKSQASTHSSNHQFLHWEEQLLNRKQPFSQPQRSNLETNLQQFIFYHNTDEAWKAFNTFTNCTSFPSKSLTNSLIIHLYSLSDAHNIKRAFAAVVYLLEKNPSLLEHESMKNLLDSLKIANSGAPTFALVRSMLKNRFFIPFEMWSVVLVDICRQNGSFAAFLSVFH